MRRRGRKAARWAGLATLVIAGTGGCATDAGRASEGSSSSRSQASPEAALGDSLVSAWIEEAGGLETWNDLRSARFTITTVWYDSLGEIRRMRPRRVEFRKAGGYEQARIERPETEGLYVQVFTGETTWATLNDARLPDDHKATEESEYVGRDVVYWFGLPYKLMDPGVNRRGRALPDGGFELEVTFGDAVGAHPGDRYYYYFLDEDPFPEEVHYIEQGREESDRNRTVWSGFGREGRFTYVLSRTWLDDAEAPTKELRIDDVQLGPALPDSLFAPPRG